MKRKLGAITVGQSPRDDVIPEMLEYLGEVEIIQAGALDHLTYEEIMGFDVKDNDYLLVSRLRDGRSVKFAERHILPRLQECIERLEKEGAEIILFICTGVFPDIFKSRVPLLYPQKILHNLVPHFLGNNKLAVVIPNKDQILQCKNKWIETGVDVDVVSGSPYSEEDEISNAIKILKSTNAELVLLDCIGYNKVMKKRIAEGTGKKVILARTMVARVLGEILNN